MLLYLTNFCIVFYLGYTRRQGVKYIMPEESTLDEFVARALAGNLEPHVRSARAPKQSAKAPVTAVVGTTFQRTVHDSTKDVLLLLCNKWAPDCPAFTTKFEKLGKKLKAARATGLMLASVDVSANDVPAEYDRALRRTCHTIDTMACNDMPYLGTPCTSAAHLYAC